MNAFNKFALRRLYNVQHAGRGERGVVRRKEYKVTLRFITFLALRELVDVGPGQYGSVVTELSIRTMIALMGATSPSDFEHLCEELSLAVTDIDAFKENLTLMSMKLKHMSLAE